MSLYLNLLCLTAGFLTFGLQALLNRFLSSLIGSAVTVQLTLLFSFFLFFALGSFLDRKSYKDMTWACLGLFSLTLFTYLSFGSFWLEVLPRHEWRLLFALGIIAPFALCVAFFIPSFTALYSGGFKGAYFSFHTGAVIGLIGIEFFSIPWLGVKKSLLILCVISFCLFMRLFLGLRTPIKLVDGKTEHQRVETQKYIQLFTYSFLSGVVSFIIFKSMNYFFGPFTQNFVLVSLISLGSLSLASLPAMSFTAWKRLIPLMLSMAFLTLGIWLNFIPTIYEQFVIDRDISRNLVVLGLMIISYGPIYFSFGLLLPAFSSENKGSVGKMIGLNSLGNALGLSLFYFLGVNFFNSVLILVLIGIFCVLMNIMSNLQDMRTKRVLLIVLPIITLAIFYVMTPANYFSYSFRYFQSVSSFSHAKENLVRVEKFQSLGSEVAIHHFKDKSETLVIDGYRSISINESSKHFESEALLGFLHSLVLSQNNKTLVLGVGSGATVVAAAKTSKYVTAVEINPAVFKYLPRFNDFNRGLLDLKNLELILDDGYSHLLKSQESYDLILNNVPTPQYSVASSIWTKEFLIQVKSRLTEKGVYAQWLNGNMNLASIKIMLATLQSSFEHCALAILGSKYFNLICSDHPLVIHSDTASVESLTKNLNLKYDVDSISSLVIVLDDFQSLDFGMYLNTLEHPILASEMDYNLDRAWRENRHWFYLDFFELKVIQLDRICKGLIQLKELLDYKELPPHCQTVSI